MLSGRVWANPCRFCPLYRDQNKYKEAALLLNDALSIRESTPGLTTSLASTPASLPQLPPLVRLLPLAHSPGSQERGVGDSFLLLCSSQWFSASDPISSFLKKILMAK